MYLHHNEKEEECYFNLVYQPYRDVDDTITGITILATEITEYVLAKNKLKKMKRTKKISKTFQISN
jgi:hypothetical protein